MSFDIFLIPSSDSPSNEDEFEQAVAAAVAEFGGPVDGVGLPVTREGFSFELFGTMFALRGWHDSMGVLLFEVGQATSSFILPVGEDSVPFRTPDNLGSPPGDLDVTLVESPAELSRRIAPHFYGWASYRDGVAQTLNEPKV